MLDRQFRLEPSRFRFKDSTGAQHEWMTCCTEAPMRRPRTIAGEEFIAGEVVVHDILCATEGAMEVEGVFRDFVWAEALNVEIGSDEMTWALGEDVLVFSR